jgi:hypothetical protein
VRRDGHILAALDAAGRNLHKIAQADRQMRADTELADQNDLVAVEIDRQDHHHFSNPQRIAHERRAVESDAVPLVSLETAAAIFRGAQHGVGRGIGNVTVGDGY